jgi:hypothetical protein
MSPRLLLQPACVSYFLLALCLWLLYRMTAGGPGRGRSAWLLLAVFVLWVNVDEWFLLGPALAALFWAGERLAGRKSVPGWLAPAGLAVCLLSPYTWHAFTLPAELSPAVWTSGLRQDARFQAAFASPWGPAYLRASAALNAAALAYFALVALSLLSFYLHPPALRGWRSAVWLPFALLAAWQARAVPFFAVVAAPVAALNLQDFFKSWGEVPAGPTAFRSLGRAALALGLAALLVLTWGGWLEGRGREGPHVGWGLQPDPSLERAAKELGRWRRAGLLAQGERFFAPAPEVAHYAAWFCPGERQFLDHRFPLFAGAAGDYEAACRGLLGEDARGWREVLRAHQVGVVVLYDREPRRLFAALGNLGGRPKEWVPLYVAGQAVLFGWAPARPPGGFAPLAFDADRLAFGPQDERAERELPPAPPEGPADLAPRQGLAGRLRGPPAPPAWETAAATVYLHYFGDSYPGQHGRRLRASLGAFAASLAGLPAAPAALPTAALEVFTSNHLLWPRSPAAFVQAEQLGPYFRHLLERPPALPLLAVRAARRGAAANPEDRIAWLSLGQAYKALRDLTCERSAEGRLPPLTQLRNVQIITALAQAVRLDPDLEPAHHELARLYAEQNALDQALTHLREELRLARRAGARPGETAEEAAHRLELLERDVAKVAETVEQRREVFASRPAAPEAGRVAEARAALRLGLARLAADEVLLPTPAALLGADGVDMELDLLLSLGEAEKVRAILNAGGDAGRGGLPSHDLPPPAGPGGAPLYPFPYRWPGYEWLRVLESAALGDYGVARATLREMRAGRRAGHERLLRQLQTLGAGNLATLPWLLSGPPVYLPAFGAHTLARVAGDRAALQDNEPFLRAQEADLCVLEGLLALEQGVPEEARRAFAEAQRLCGPPAGPAVSFAGGPIAGAYLSLLGGAGRR